MQGVEHKVPGRIRGRAVISDGSAFFDGHFPGHPVLPGIAQLALVEQTLRIAGANKQISGLTRVKFRRRVKTWSSFTIDVFLESDQCTFELYEQHDMKEAICDGAVRTAQEALEAVEPASASRASSQKMQDTLEDLIPHRQPMRLVDQILEISESRCVTSTRARESWPMGDEHGISSIVLVEAVAQTAAALGGWESRRRGITENIGYLLGVRAAQWSTPLIPVDCELVSTVEPLSAGHSYAMFKGRVESPSGLSARMEIQVIRQGG